MPLLIDPKKRVLVQGITGREGRLRTRYMLDYGTNVVAGSAPGRAGQDVFGVPVFDSVADAARHAGSLDVSVIFVPGPDAKSAALDAVEAGISFVVLIADRVPVYDVLEVCAAAKLRGVSVLGPNTAGVIVPDQAVVGLVGGSAKSVRAWLHPGPAGLISRSGGMGVAAAYELGQSGVGISTLVHVGGDAVLGTRMEEIAAKFQSDPDTKAIVLVGEIGTSQEEQVAALMKSGTITKPVIAHIGGRSAQSGMRYSHAGAIVEKGAGTYDAKRAALESAGGVVVDSFSQLSDAVRRSL